MTINDKKYLLWLVNRLVFKYKDTEASIDQINLIINNNEKTINDLLFKIKYLEDKKEQNIKDVIESFEHINLEKLLK